MTICIPTKPYIVWINVLLGECAYEIQDAFSIVLGYLSILCWLNAQLPQVIENYRLGSASSLSISFLAIWFAGDTANLIGAILTHQLPFQIYLGIYFVFIDVCLLFQWIYYNQLQNIIKDTYLIIPNSDIKKTGNLIRQPASHSPLLINTSIVPDELTSFSSSASPSKWYTMSSEEKSSTTTKLMVLVLFSTKLFQPSSSAIYSNQETSIITQDNMMSIGRVFAWMCVCLYLVSRIPQIIKNYRRQSVDGLSISLFIFAALGNLTYFTSVILHTHTSLIEALPYLIGSAGTLAFDFSIFCQFLCFRKSNKDLEFV